jgi:CRISPR-associated endonuclease/helicase Cas3
VAERARAFVSGVACSDRVARAVVLAARAHDHGKAHPRWQAYYRGGVSALLAEPIAKSVFGTADVRAHRAARSASGLPARLRHEVDSVAILATALDRGWVADLEPPDVDLELALHLVAVHHGLGRPIPLVPHPEIPARPYAVDAAGVAGQATGDTQEGWAGGSWLRRFFAVVDAYGPWGTAYLEALLVLADRCVSAEGC